MSSMLDRLPAGDNAGGREVAQALLGVTVIDVTRSKRRWR